MLLLDGPLSTPQRAVGHINLRPEVGMDVENEELIRRERAGTREPLHLGWSSLQGGGY